MRTTSRVVAPIFARPERALDRFVLPVLVDAWIDRLRRHGDERDDADQRRADVYSSARIMAGGLGTLLAGRAVLGWDDVR